MAVWYTNYGDGSTTGYYAVPKWTTGTKTAGAIIRQFTTPTTGSERCFVCTIGGAASGTEPATWTVTKGGVTTDGAVTWMECTGQPAVNGDNTNTPAWLAVKNTAVALGYIIKDGGSPALRYFICTTAGTAGNAAEPTWNTTAGGTTADNTVTWTTLGLVGAFVTAYGAPHARMPSAANWGAGGDTFYVADNHAETQASAGGLTAPGTASAPSIWLCVDRTKAPPAATADLRTTATLTTTGASQVAIVGFGYFNGFTFSAGSGASNANIVMNQSTGQSTTLENCNLILGGTGTASLMQLGSTQRVHWDIRWRNVTVKFAHVNQSIILSQCSLDWRNTPAAVQGATIPTGLLQASSAAGNAATVYMEGVDLSAVGSGKNVFFGSAPTISAIMKDCKLNAAGTIGILAASTAQRILCVRCDSGTTSNNNMDFQYYGTMITERVVVRNLGDGTVSWNISTVAATSFLFPYKGIPIAINNLTIGANVTVTVEGMYNAAALPLNDEVWFDVEYLGSAATPQGSFASSVKSSVLATAASLTASTTAWDALATARVSSHAYNLGDVYKAASNPGRLFFCTTAGSSAGSEPGGVASCVDGGSVTDGGAVFRAGVRFKQAVTLSSPQPAQAGDIYVTPNVGKASVAAGTIFIDPFITLS